MDLAAQSLRYESLLIKNPQGYKIIHSKKSGRIAMAEMIPEGERLQNWTQMLTTQIFFGGIAGRSPEDFYHLLYRRWKRACPQAKREFVGKGRQNGYRYAEWMFYCSNNQLTKKPENTLFKAIEGNDSFYVVQKAWKYTPSKKDKARWLRYLDRVRVCDPRIKDRPCPKLKRKK